MAKLNTLTFIQLPKSSGNDPVVTRRNKLVARLQQQRSLAEDPSFVIKTQKWIPDESGVKHLQDRQKRVKPWWRTDTTGAIVLTVRYGARPIEFQKGKSAIAVGTKDKLLHVIDTVITAVTTGELDTQLEQVSKAVEFKKRRSA